MFPVRRTNWLFLICPCRGKNRYFVLTRVDFSPICPCKSNCPCKGKKSLPYDIWLYSGCKAPKLISTAQIRIYEHRRQLNVFVWPEGIIYAYIKQLSQTRQFCPCKWYCPCKGKNIWWQQRVQQDLHLERTIQQISKWFKLKISS